MKVNINAGNIGNQTIIEKIEKGDVVVGGSELKELSKGERSDLISNLLEDLRVSISDVDTEALSEEHKQRILDEVGKLKSALDTDKDPQEISISGLMTSMNENLGVFSGILTKSLQLAQFFGLK